MDRFWSKVSRPSPNGCWEWTGARDRRSGHGQFKLAGRVVGAHRVAYELLVGPIPPELVLDHLCRNTPCVNPAHLEPVTNRENVLRGTSPCAQNAAKTHCAYGHPFDGNRLCRICHRRRDQERAPARKAHDRTPIGVTIPVVTEAMWVAYWTKRTLA